MGRNHYHKCLHIDYLQSIRDKGQPYICLNVAGTIQLVLLCKECHTFVRKGKTVDVKIYGGRHKERKLKKYNGDTEPSFFELTVI